MKKELTMQDYIRLIFRRRWIILSSTFGVLLATGLFMLFSPSIYESASIFMLETQDLSFTDKGMMMAEQSRPMGYYQAIMKSRLYRSRVQEAFFEPSESDIPENFDRNEFNNIYKSSVSLESAEYTDFITLKARANNPHVAYRIAVVSTQVLKNRCQEIDREELQNAVTFIDQQTEVSKTKLEEAESALQEFRRTTKISISNEEGGLLNELVRMENKLTDVQTQRQLIASNIAGYKRRLSRSQTIDETGEGSIQSVQVEAFKNQLADLEKTRQEKILLLGANHPDVQAIEKEVERVKRSYINEVMQQSLRQGSSLSDAEINEMKGFQERLISEEINLFAMENQEQYYQRLIEQFKVRHPNIMDQSIELMRLTRAQTVAENLYTFLLEKGEESKIKAATGTGGIRIVDEPVLPTHPVPENVPRKLLMGLILGLGLGFGLALIKEYTDNAIYTKADITQNYNLVVVGEIPAYGGIKPMELPLIGKKKKDTRDKHLVEGPLLTQMPLKSGTSEAFRSLRSNMQFANVDKNLNSLVISSSNAEEGKSLTSANLAIAYALLGEDVILVDADLRKPRLHRLFDCQKSPGLTECLLEGLSVDKVIQKTNIEHLHLVTSGATPPNPSEIMSSKRMEKFVEDIKKRAQLSIYDSAPLLPVTDTLVLAGRTDGVLLIVKHGRTSRFDLDHVIEMLQNARIRIVGTVLNQIPVSRIYGYYYYYGRGYKGYY